MIIVKIKDENKESKYWNCTISIFNNESLTSFYLKVNDCIYNIKQELFNQLINLDRFSNLYIDLNTCSITKVE